MKYLLRELPDHVEVLSGYAPPSDACFKSDTLQILCNTSDTPWVDDGLHAHTESDEAYIVQEGTITLDIDGEIKEVGPGSICVVGRNVFHAVIKVETPYQGLVIRAPSVQDKIYPK